VFLSDYGAFLSFGLPSVLYSFISVSFGFQLLMEIEQHTYYHGIVFFVVKAFIVFEPLYDRTIVHSGTGGRWDGSRPTLPGRC
jgi:hypothetical protein